MGIPKPFKSLGLPTRVYITTVVKYLLMKLPTYNWGALCTGLFSAAVLWLRSKEWWLIAMLEHGQSQIWCGNEGLGFKLVNIPPEQQNKPPGQKTYPRFSRWHPCRAPNLSKVHVAWHTAPLAHDLPRRRRGQFSHQTFGYIWWFKVLRSKWMIENWI